MRIPYFKLVNFKGIWAGMKISEFEIDLRESDKRNIMFLGENGSGKSTAMSMLTPFAESFDGRTELILEGKEGYKEIHYQKDEDYYVIQHFYKSGKVKSFMFKNGTDDEHNLNGNGGKRTFEALCEKELGVTPEHFKLVRIGSGSTSLIDMNSSARKQFMQRFTPSVEEYTNHFKIVNDKFNASGKEIKHITDELGRLDSEADVTTQIDILTKTLKKNTAEANAIAVELGTVQKENEAIDENLEAFASDLEQRLLLIEQRDGEEAKLEAIYEKFPKRRGIPAEELKEKIESLNEKLKELRVTQSKLNVEREKLQSNKHNASKNKAAAEADERKYSSPTSASIANMKLQLQEHTENLRQHTERFNSISEFDSKLVESFELEEATASVNELSRFANRLVEAKHDLSSYDQEVIESVLFDIGGSALNANISEYSGLIETTEKEISGLKKRLRQLEDDKIASEAVRRITAMCKTSTCAVYRIGQKELEKDGEQVKVEEQIQLKEDELAELHATLTMMQMVQRHYKLFNESVYMSLEMHSITASKSDLVELLSLGDATEIGRITYQSSGEDIGKQYDFGRLVTKINLSQKMKDTERAKVNTKERIDNLQNAEQLLVDIRQRIATHREEINTMTSEEADLIEKIDAVDTEIDTKEQIVELYSAIYGHMVSIKDIDKSLKTLNKIYERNKDSITKRDSNIDKMEEIKIRKVNADEIVIETSDSLNKEKLKLERITQYKERKDALVAIRDKLMIVRDTLDIKTGMPLYVLGVYLGEIKESTNDLLNMAFGESFFIDFHISDEDFLVPVYQNNVMYNKDVKSCSQGETALIKCALSLGISSSAIKRKKEDESKYNIVYLDEIDAELDTVNRKRFIDILDVQLDTLNCEQCFMITHNDAFHAAELALILLPGSSVETDDTGFMANKEIIADYRKKSKK